MTDVAPDLAQQRLVAARAWSAFVEHGDAAADLVRPEILRSWRISRRRVPVDLGEAPMDDETEVRSSFSGSPLQLALERVESELRRTADDGDLVVAVTDPGSTILWTYGQRAMRRQAERVNFVPGARWDEQSVGTNALGMSARTGEAVTVFSAEHYAPMVHGWVCWAAPLHDPVTGERIGVLDLSTTWDRAHPIGLATARLTALLVESAMPHATARHGARPGGGSGARVRVQPESRGELSLTLLGAAEARLNGAALLLNRRQTEILALLALHPEGLSLETLHALVYGDQPVSPSTLKAEVSHLRGALGGRLASRPYRLQLDVTTDVHTVLRLLRAGHVGAAVSVYGGDLVPGTEAPGLTELADYVAVAVREALLAHPDPDAVLRYSELAPHDTEVLEAGLAGIEPGHRLRPLLKGRLAAAGA